jgi:hypothetical protein
MRNRYASTGSSDRPSARSEASAGLLTSFTTMLSEYNSRLAIRITVVLIALAVLYLRTSTTFTTPQFWGEDIIFFDESRAYGWFSLLTAVAGWLAGVQFFVACLASYFNPIYAPAIYNGSAIALTLLVVWMTTSPRLDMPYKPLLALALVVVPMAYEEVGTITNSQWILPIGAVALMFMRPAASPGILLLEVAFVSLTAFSGPFALFLTPMFLWRLLTAERGSSRRRFLILTTVSGIGAISQGVSLLLNPSILSSVAPAPFHWTTWVNLPFTQWMTTFGPVSKLFKGTFGFALGLGLLLVAFGLACQKPYRTQKLFMMFFSCAIVASALYKFRDALGTQTAAQRYFYFGGVFALWFICCLSNRPYFRTAFAASVGLIEIALLPIVANTPRITKDLQWPVWSSYLSSGLATIIPSSPDGWYIHSPPSSSGPLSSFASWLGRDIAELSDRVDDTACSGTAGPVSPLGPVSMLQHARASELPKDMWTIRGSAWNTKQNQPVQLVVLANDKNRVVGFGFPGFQASNASAPLHSGWIGIFPSDPDQTLRAFGIVNNGQSICLLANKRYFPTKIQPLASNQFIEGIKIIPGMEIVQRFKTSYRLEGIAINLVTWGLQPSPYNIRWKVVGYSGTQTTELGAGAIESTGITDWLRFEFPISKVPSDVPDLVEVIFRADGDQAPSAPVGLPIYRPTPNSTATAVELGGIPVHSGGLLGLDLSYAAAISSTKP